MIALCYKHLTHFRRVFSRNKERFEAIFVSATFKKTKKLYIKEFNVDFFQLAWALWVRRLRKWVGFVGMRILWVKGSI